MKAYFVTFLTVTVFTSSVATQVRYTDAHYRDYSKWFKGYSQTFDLQRDGAELYSFVQDAPVRRAPLPNAAVTVRLALGQMVRNVAIAPADAVYAVINGYRDQWRLVEACDADGNHFAGYVWGGHLAKSYQSFDLDNDGRREMILLGLGEAARRAPEDLRAGLKIVRDGKTRAEMELNGICLFTECEAYSLLRVFDFADNGQTIVFESSVLSEGCLSGVDKALVAWDGQALRLIHRAEYTTGHTYVTNPLYLHHPTQTRICYYQSENANYEPVWSCRTLENGVVTP